MSAGLLDYLPLRLDPTGHLCWLHQEFSSAIFDSVRFL